MLKMSEWAPQSLGGSMSAGEALDPKGDEGEPSGCSARFCTLEVHTSGWLFVAVQPHVLG